MVAIGQSVTRIDAVGKVMGETRYPGDFNMPGQVFMKVVFSGRAHAIIRSIDKSRAMELPGVLAVLTAEDVPVNEYGLGTPDQPVLCGPGSIKPYADRVRFAGDQVALILAENEKIAREAEKLLDIQYEDIPAIYNPLEALEEGSLKVHPDYGSNVFCHYRIRRGDVDEAFKSADVVIEGVYETPAQEHAYLQPEAGISHIDEEGRITVVVAGQWTHEDREQIAHAMNMPEEKIRVIYPAIGGAFGGREDMSVQIVLALSTWKLHEMGVDRPVKTVWSREESIVGHHKRHPFHIHTRWAATKEGKLLAAEVDMVEDGGAYVYTSPKVLGNATLMCTGPYNIPNVKVDARAVYTNNLPNGAFRGFGGPQAAFSAEMQMDKLAEALGMDPVEIRMRNLFQDGDILSMGSPLPKGVTIKQVVEKAALAGGWVKGEKGWTRPQGYRSDVPGKPHLKRGVGFACSYKNVGFSFGAPERSWARVRGVRQRRDREGCTLPCRCGCWARRPYGFCPNGRRSVRNTGPEGRSECV